MNAVAILWPTAYNMVCEFLGANWYALVASAGLALLVLIHIIYAVMLTLQNRKARGNQRYAISKRPNNVEWSSQNMLVLGIVVVAFLIVHLIQFWSKMQLAEICGTATLPPAAGTLFLQKAFECPWTWVVYAIGFIALWLHLNHGMWSMFQSVGWDNTTWLPRLKKIACWWTSIVVVLFFVELAVFSYRANDKYYLTNQELREQYKDMVVPMVEESFGPEGTQLAMQIKMSPYDQVSMGLRQMSAGIQQQMEQLNTPEGKAYVASNPQVKEQADKMVEQKAALDNVVALFDYLENADNKPEMQPMGAPGSVNQPQ
jgi:succinate dehydrogenase / fumarate reductase cytochrome b subunit